MTHLCLLKDFVMNLEKLVMNVFSCHLTRRGEEEIQCTSRLCYINNDVMTKMTVYVARSP